MRMRFVYLIFLVLFTKVSADDLALKAQDPLADITALMTDNTIGFKQGVDEDVGYNFQLQPVKSFETPWNGRIIVRGIIPIVGAPTGSDFPWLGEIGLPVEDPPEPSQTIWGLSDSMVQIFFAPKTSGNVKWGVGPQFSLCTHTRDALKGPSWGGGVAAVIFGSLDSITWGAVVNQLWGDDGHFSLFGVQPILNYNMDDGYYIGYNNSITCDWKQDRDNKWTVPLGLTLGRRLLPKLALDVISLVQMRRRDLKSKGNPLPKINS